MARLYDTNGRTLFSDGNIDLAADLLRIAIRKGVDLRAADLSGRDLSGMDLSKLDFFHADFSGADLTGANLSGCDLRQARFNSADLSGADLSLADARGASFFGAVIDTATRFKDLLFFGSEFEGAILKDKQVALMRAPESKRGPGGKAPDPDDRF